jgi:hypothetical protein
MRNLQQALLSTGQQIPGIALEEPDNLVHSATLAASSQLQLHKLPDDSPPLQLSDSWAMLLPMDAGPVPGMKPTADVERPTSLHVEFRTSSRLGNFTPDRTLATQAVNLLAGQDQVLDLDFP